MDSDAINPLTNVQFHSVSPSQLKSLKARWHTSLLYLLPSPPTSVLTWFSLNSWLENILNRHTKEEQRHYHTLNHLMEVFALLDEAMDTGGDNCSNIDAAVCNLSTFFHDSIYDPLSPSNEEDSADLWLSFCSSPTVGIPSESPSSPGRLVFEYVMATKHHSLPTKTPPDPWMGTFVDADLGVLAKVPSAYDNYAGLIRLEYSHIPRHTYCVKRAEVLTSILEGRVYETKGGGGDEEGEVRAKGNLRREIEKLKEGIIPGERGGGGGD
ncbi:hypothetical protein TrCOL_g933 [Triparma columacea]|uniref:Uncharacterized protein n=1 Tax=Triparma columacea TaxID=722753 RepID=A0A9W7GCE0_9STRA|nr:hypothetical protein TrCOL_g933 [Triparma columacea]